MYSFNVLVLLFLVIGVINSRHDDGGKVHIAVYYESLCPDSEAFVRDQLLPQVQSQPDNVKVTLVPFGKAYSVSGSSFQCQHGQNECAGNKFQDCALYMMRAHSDLDKVKYVNCELSTMSGVHGSFKCVKEVPNLDANAVNACVKGNLGVYLQKQSERATFSVRKPLSFVPTVTIDGVFNQNLQDLSLRNLNEALTVTRRLKTKSSLTDFNLL